ncbi:MAG: hypothetical protein ACREXR_02900 [Gammaproteobacteria bacterium]
MEKHVNVNMLPIAYLLLPPALASLLSALVEVEALRLIYGNVGLINSIKGYDPRNVEFISFVSVLYVLLLPLIWAHFSAVAEPRNVVKAKDRIIVTIAAMSMVIFPAIIVFCGPHVSAFSGVSISARLYRLAATNSLVYSLVFAGMAYVGTVGAFVLKVIFAQVARGR